MASRPELHPHHQHHIPMVSTHSEPSLNGNVIPPSLGGNANMRWLCTSFHGFQTSHNRSGLASWERVRCMLENCAIDGCL